MKTKKIIPGTVKINSQICDDGGGNLITNKGKFELGKKNQASFYLLAMRQGRNYQLQKTRNNSI